MAKKILIVEDEIALQETLSYNLEREGYQVTIEGDGIKALELAQEMEPDLILMDIMLPGLDGLEITRILRQKLSVPIIMLTARDAEIDRVLGLEIGADDYLVKPFSMRELLARVKAQFRRARLLKDELHPPQDQTTPTLIFGDLRMDLHRGEAFLNNKPLLM